MTPFDNLMNQLSGQQAPQVAQPNYWLTAAGNMDPMAPGFSGIAKGLAAAEKQRYEADLERAKLTTLTPYQQLQVVSMAENRRQQASQLERLQEMRAIAAARTDDPDVARLILLGGLDDQLDRFVGVVPKGTSAEVSGLRKEFTGLSQISAYTEAKRAYDQMVSVMEDPDNPYGALSTVYLFMRSLDPTSVVQRSEAGLMLDAQGPAARIAAEFNKLRGKGGSTEQGRKNVVRASRALLEGAYGGAKEAQERYERIATERLGVEPYYVTGDRFEMPELPDWAKDEPLTVIPGVKPEGRKGTVEDVRKLLTNPFGGGSGLPSF